MQPIVIKHGCVCEGGGWVGGFSRFHSSQRGRVAFSVLRCAMYEERGKGGGGQARMKLPLFSSFLVLKGGCTYIIIYTLERSPLACVQAFPSTSFSCPIKPSDVLRLAAQPEADARLVIEEGRSQTGPLRSRRRHPWQVLASLSGCRNFRLVWKHRAT